MTDQAREAAPVAPVAPVAADVEPGSAAGDPYAWMRDPDLPALHDYLAAERAYYDREMAPARELEGRLLAEMTARVAPAEDSVSWRRGGWQYFTRVAEATEEAVINSLLQSVTVTGRDGNTSRQLPVDELRSLVAGHPARSRA